MFGNASTYSQEELLDRGAARIFSKPFQPAKVAERPQRVRRPCRPVCCPDG